MATVCQQPPGHGWTAGFRLDTLLKLADVKGTDRRTSLLHFVLAQLVAAEGAGVAPLVAPLAAVPPAANLQARALSQNLHIASTAMLIAALLLRRVFGVFFIASPLPFRVHSARIAATMSLSKVKHIVLVRLSPLRDSMVPSPRLCRWLPC